MKNEKDNKRWRSPSGREDARVSQAVNLRIRYEDMDLIRDAAEKMCLPMAAFIRMAALKEAKSVNVRPVSAS
ncbi:hypothetical protein [Neisseria dumasiana]|uniref:DUF1778 domain-containing protein n=1 Tax=Neisseria dumasiana TaxID=1931275 RepID=A0A1X3DKW4_9NEIS|nr:hypothetical protein [Neisseria dumasiana]OSI24655.1 hypothetical protein BV912_02030 [Neisseria dumasiana]